MSEVNKNKILGEVGVVRLVENIKDNFAPINHEHTHEEVGADKAGSAAAALTLAKQYADEQVALKSQVQIITWEADD